MSPITPTAVRANNFMPSEHQIHEFLIVARKVATAAALVLISISSYPFLTAATLFSAVILDCALHVDIEKKPAHVTIAQQEKEIERLNETLNATRDRVTALEGELADLSTSKDANFSFSTFFNLLQD